MSSPKKRMRAGGRREVAGDRVEQRRLAGAVRAEHRAPFAGRDPQIDVGERDQRAEMPADALELERMAPPEPWRRVGDDDWSATGVAPSVAAYGQLGLSRPTTPSFRNSSSAMPSVWLTCGITSTTLL